MDRDPTRYIGNTLEWQNRELDEKIVLGEFKAGTSLSSIREALSSKIDPNENLLFGVRPHYTANWEGPGHSYSYADIKVYVTLGSLTKTPVSEEIQKKVSYAIRKWSSFHEDLKSSEGYLLELKAKCDESMKKGQMDMDLFKKYEDASNKIETAKKQLEKYGDRIRSFVELFSSVEL